MEVVHIVSAVIVGLCAGLIGVALTRLPRSSVRLPVFLFIGAGILCAVGDLLATLATAMPTKVVGLAVLYTGSISMPALWWIVALRWAHEVDAGLPLRSKVWTVAPIAFAASMWAVMITNPWHGAFITPVVGGRNVYGPLWYVGAFPNYGMIFGALGVGLAVAWRVARSDVRRQAACLVSATLVTLVGSTPYIADWVRLDLAPVLLSLSGVLLVFGMAREGLFGVMPWALADVAADHPDGLVVVGPEGGVRYANDRARALLAPAELVPGSSLAATLREIRLRPESPELEPLEDGSWAMLGRPDGALFRTDVPHPRWLQINASAVRGGRGGTKGYCVRIADRTARQEAELRTRQTRRLDSVAELARTLSRQFRGAFALVHENAEMLLAAPGDRPAATDRKLARIIEASKYGSELAQELQLYTGSVSTTRVVVELSEVVEESCALVESDLPPGVRLVFARAAELLPVHVDAIQLRHAIFNVVTNAIEAMARTPGEIRVTTGIRFVDPARESLVWGAQQPPGEFAFVAVRDEGPGMDPETEERAFEPFFSTRGKERGNGLSIVLGIARAHDALIALENERGRGCTVTLFFPREGPGERADDVTP